MQSASDPSKAGFRWAALFFIVPALVTCDGGGTEPLEEGIGQEGGTVSLASGAVTLSIPAGALSTPVTFTATPTTAVPASDLFVPGSAHEIGPSGTTFAVSVTLTLSYDPANLPVGVQESELRLYKVVGSGWELMDNASVNTAAHTVSGGVTSLSRFGARGLPVSTVEVFPTTADLEPGGTVQLNATPRASDGRALESRSVQWSSSDEAVATVSSLGLVTGVGQGSATITGMSGGKSGTAAVTVIIPVASVEVTPGSSSVNVGQTLQFTGTPKDAYGNALSRTVTWSSSDEAVATVDGSGLVTGIAEGTATVTGTSEGVTGTATVTVNDPVTSIEVSPLSAALTVGQTTQLSAIPKGVGGNVLEGRAVTWASNDEGVATVSAAGLVSGIGVGTVTITATSEGVLGTASVTVTPMPVASVEVSPPGGSVQVGETLQLTATTKGADGSVLSGRTIGWWSSNTAVATVSGSGLVMGVSTGTATITATSEGVLGTASVTVTSVPVASVEVSPPVGSVQVGETLQLTAITKGADGTVLSGRTINWWSSNTAVATVTDSGLVMGVSTGTTTIVAMSEGISGTASVTVMPMPVASVEVSPPVGSVQVGETLQLTATTKGADGSVLSGRTISWASNHTAVATVSGSGLVTGVSSGTATITAISEGVLGTAAVTVTPVPVASVWVSPPSGAMQVGETLQLTATTKGADGTVLSGRTVGWSSSNTAAATVSGSGLVMGVSTGTATITATSEGVSGTASMTVTPVGFAYVALQTLNQVSVISRATHTVVATVEVGIAPKAMAATPDGAFMYVVNGTSDDVSVISTATNTVVATIGVGRSPLYVEITPDGAFAYVVSSESFNPGTVSVISTATNTVVATFEVAIGSGPMVMTPDGAFVYLMSGYARSIDVISTATNTVVTTIGLAGSMAMTPDGAFLYLTSSGDRISVISTATNTVVETIPVGSGPSALAFTPDGAFAYVVNRSSDDVSVISTATNTVVATVPVGYGPWVTPAITPDGALVYVPNNQSDDVSVISTATNTVVATVSLVPAASAWSVSMTSDGTLAYVGTGASNYVSVISTATNTLVASVWVGWSPHNIVIIP